MSVDYSGFKLNDKIAIVTGPSQGIGRAIALGLGAGRRPPGPGGTSRLAPGGSQEVSARSSKWGARRWSYPPIYPSVAQIRAMVDKAKEVFGRIDILVNNASWTCTGRPFDATEEDYDGTLTPARRNVFSRARPRRASMIPQGGGRIVNIGSNFAVSAFPDPSHLRRRQGRRASVVPGAVPGVGQAGSGGERGGACITETPSRRADSGEARLQGVGH